MQRGDPGGTAVPTLCWSSRHIEIPDSPLVYDGDAEPPEIRGDHLGPQRHHAPQAMPIEAGATYVFDLGYYDHTWWKKLDEAQCRIITRFKKNTPLQLLEELSVARGRGELEGSPSNGLFLRTYVDPLSIDDEDLRDFESKGAIAAAECRNRADSRPGWPARIRLFRTFPGIVRS